jgi:hypothetical protein
MLNKGEFVLSLDFELLWGVMDSRGAEYHPQIKEVHAVIPQLLTLFEKYKIACTWATVGFLLADNSEDLTEKKPVTIPKYSNDTLNPYSCWDQVIKNDTKLIFAPDMVKQILKTPNQELASHTFSHYYCLEEGQYLSDFEADLKAMNEISKGYNVQMKSLVFPRNQFKSSYLKACLNAGLIAYRGNPDHWAYRASNVEKQTPLKRIFRLLDAYIPISGSQRQKIKKNEESGMINIPASLFLRPWSNRLSCFEFIRLWRIKWSMKQAAKKGGIFHLWWHPHNFSKNTQNNLIFLEKIFLHYQTLNRQYGFKSSSMIDVATEYNQHSYNKPKK